MPLLVTCKFEKDLIKKQQRKGGDIVFPIISQWASWALGWGGGETGSQKLKKSASNWKLKQQLQNISNYIEASTVQMYKIEDNYIYLVYRRLRAYKT